MNPLLEELQMALTRLAPPTPAPAPAAPPTNPGEATPAPAPAPAPAAPPPPTELVDPKRRGIHLDSRVAPEHVVAAAELLDRNGFSIDSITGVDWMAAGEMEVIYDFYHLTAPLQVVVRVRVPRSQPEVPTISGVFPGANWHERETFEFLGIRFLGHPNLVPLLLPEDATYHPLRKDFAGVA